MAENQSPAPAARTGTHLLGIGVDRAAHPQTEGANPFRRIKAADHMKADPEANGADFALPIRGKECAATHTSFARDFLGGLGFPGKGFGGQTFLTQHPVS